MRIPKETDHLIARYIAKQAAQDDIEQLTQWLSNADNQKIFNEFVEINHTADCATKKFNSKPPLFPFVDKP